MTDKTGKNNDGGNKTQDKLPEDNLVTTRHEITIDGTPIPYTVTTGTIVLREETDKKDNDDKRNEADGEQPKASLFFVAYTRDDVDAKEKRPITFSFNGGPGSSSVWLHLGVLGPKRVLMDDEGWPLPPPYRLVENECSVLDVTDLVFIDPISTGFSRPVPGEEAKQFHNFTRDIESVGDFIRLYTTRYKRWSSPKFLAGESYGTTRAAGLSGYLQERHGMYLNGIMLVSSVLDFQTIRFTPGNDMPFLLYLPVYAATAWYHKRLPDDLQQLELQSLLNQVETYAMTSYALALLKGDALSRDERQEVVQTLARYTGLSEDYVDRTDLRIDIQRFTKELLRDQRRTVGRIDSRYTGIDRDAAGEHFEVDPSMSATSGPYTATFNDYVRDELQYESDLPYEILARLYQTWSYKEFEGKFVYVAETLRKAMTANPSLKVHVTNGYYDLATPYFATEYTFNHLGLDESLRDNVNMSYYEAGHMMYVRKRSLVKMKEELASFVEDAIPAPQQED
ncbi:MAG: peptidase S10 [Chloroflexota bacterium]|nr:peptidase S10 [Chloroflexota bacterium]